MQKIFDFFTQNNEFGKNIGVELIEVKYGYAKVQMQVTKFHLNLAGVCHGGAIFTLADYAFAVASNSFGKVALGINANISFINSAKEGDILIAEAKLIDESNRLGTYEIKVMDNDKVIASVNGTVYKTTKNFKELKDDLQ
jgi:acyl-CoA thioesterase